MSFVSEFREFAVKGSVVDLAVGVIIGGAFGKIVDSIVKDLIMPIVGRIFGGLDFSNWFIPRGALRGADQTRRADPLLRQLHHGVAQFCHPRLHHFPDGEADQPTAAHRAPASRGASGRRPSAAGDSRRLAEIATVARGARLKSRFLV